MTSVRNFLAAAAVAILAAGTALAQDTPPASAPPPPDQSMPSSSVDMTGQRVYNSDGDSIGTVTSMTTDAHGQRLAAVEIGHNLSIHGTTVLFPIGALQPREKGGYMTNLSGDQIKQLPKANATNTP